MKVIAEIPTGRYSGPDLLIQISRDELKKLAFADVFNDAKFEIGTKLNVNDQYERLKELNNNRKKLDEAIGVLRAVATTLSPLADIVTLPAPKPPAPHEGEQEGGESNG